MLHTPSNNRLHPPPPRSSSFHRQGGGERGNEKAEEEVATGKGRTDHPPGCDRGARTSLPAAPRSIRLLSCSCSGTDNTMETETEMEAACLPRSCLLAVAGREVVAVTGECCWPVSPFRPSALRVFAAMPMRATAGRPQNKTRSQIHPPLRRGAIYKRSALRSVLFCFLPFNLI
jgi:hypothetical protein